MDYSFDLRDACALAEQTADTACAIALQGALEPRSTTVKDFDEQVTSTDLEVERVIRSVIRGRSAIPILGEEEGLDSGGDCRRRWVADPIDGTTNSLHGFPLYVVSIALLDGVEAKVGVIAQPSTGLVVAGFKGGGIRVKGSPWSRPKTLIGNPLIVLEHGYDPQDQLRAAELMRALCGRYSIRLFGATAFALAYLATGRCDGVISCGDKLWDLAAGTCVVREAGGIVTDWNGIGWEDGNHCCSSLEDRRFIEI
jgi:myo-inositol-1(or 4)-monophosphatase